jgi:aspartate/methionine/tyrosine aminotransferase
VQIADFALERYFARWEFSARYNLCASDVEGLPMRELLSMADDECRERWDGLTLGYTEAPGMPALRAEVARLYDGLGPEHVYMFAGAEEGIFVALHAMLGSGDHAVVVWPGYQALHEVARSAGADVTLVELRAEDDWQLDVDALAAAIRPGRTRVVVLNYPHSPTGAQLDRPAFARVAQLTADAGARLLIDEVYRFLEYDDAGRLPAGAEIGSHGVSLGVMSKAFGLAGLRIGWLATTDEELLARCARLKDYTTICNSAPSEILALIALRARDALTERARRIVAPNLEAVDAVVTGSPHLDWVRPRAGSVGFPRLAVDEPVERFADALVREAGVLILPGSAFDHPGNHFRVGLGRLGIPDALDHFQEFLDSRFP